MSRGRFTRAGGFILAASIIAGSVAGAMVAQSSIGFLVGAGVGALLSVLIWVNDRRR